MTSFLGFHIRRDGYGAIHSGVEKAMLCMGVPWRFVDMCDNGTWTKANTRTWDIDDTAIVLTLPDWLPDVKAPKRYAFTMYESTQTPAYYAPEINKCDALIVPTQWNADIFKANGVTVPTYICPLGIDPDEYAPMERNGSHTGKPYTFLWSGTPDKRKGWDIVYQAFWKAFKGDEATRLVMHFRKLPKGLSDVKDHNVELYAGKFFPDFMNEMLRVADCFVYPARGEGWGLHPREAAATGLPAIATNWGGLMEGIDYWGLPLNDNGLSHAEFGAWTDDLGQWAEPSVDELAEKMRWCFENQKSAAYFGQNAAQWLKQNQTWSHTATRLKQIVEP